MSAVSCLQVVFMSVSCQVMLLRPFLRPLRPFLRLMRPFLSLFWRFLKIWWSHKVSWWIMATATAQFGFQHWHYPFQSNVTDVAVNGNCVVQRRYSGNTYFNALLLTLTHHLLWSFKVLRLVLHAQVARAARGASIFFTAIKKSRFNYPITYVLLVPTTYPCLQVALECISWVPTDNITK